MAIEPSTGSTQEFRKIEWPGAGALSNGTLSSMIVAAGGDHRHRAAVLDTICVRVDTLVQLRRGIQRHCPEKCERNARRDECTPAIY